MGISHSVIDTVVAHAREAAPAECCGILIGTIDCIVQAVPARNLSANPNRFVIDPKDHIDARRNARRDGLDVVGFYHSHPHSSPEPSPTDLAEASYPDLLYLIVGLKGAVPELRLFRLAGRNFLPTPLVTVA